MSNNVPITNGQGQSSVAAEEIGTIKFQQIKVTDGRTGSSSMMTVNRDGSISVSVIGTLTATITGSPSISGAVTVVGTPSISGTVDIGVIPGSVVSYQGGAWVNSIAGAVQIAGISPASIATVKRIDVQVVAADQGIVSNAVIHGLTTGGGGGYVDVKVDPSGALVTTASSVVTFQGGTQITSLVSTVPSSVLVGASIFGQLPAGTAVLGSIAALQGTTPWAITNVGSVITVPTGSVVTTQIGSVITVWKDSSVLSVPTGSTIAVLQAPSIVGTYAEDSAHTTGDKGVFVLQVRNDTMSSITSTDADYSPQAVGPTGEVLVANAPITKWVSGTADLRGAGSSGSSVVAIAAQGSSIFTYITGVQVANMGSASVLVTLAAGGSTLGYTIAPAGGGSNIYYQNGLKTPANFGFAASISGVASVLVSAQGFIAKI